MASILSYVRSIKILHSRVFWIALMIAASLTVAATSTLLSFKTVTITDGTTTLNVTTGAHSVGAVLEKQGIVLNDGDTVFPEMDFALKDGQTITINRAFPVLLKFDGAQHTVNTVGVKVVDLLKQQGIPVGEFDMVTPDLDQIVTSDTEISIIRVAKKHETKQEEVPFETISRPSETIERGRTVTVQEGQPGQKEMVYQIMTHDGQEVSRALLYEKTIKAPIEAISEQGTQVVELVSRSGESASSGVDEAHASAAYSESAAVATNQRVDNASSAFGGRSILCNATAYDLSYESCGKYPGDPYYGVTASGMMAAVGVVAVDPSVIPMGTRLYIASTDHTPDYGYAIAGDTGGAIIGNKVDLFMNTREEALSFGRRNVIVYILD